jgi:hypothetical protein
MEGKSYKRSDDQSGAIGEHSRPDGYVRGAKEHLVLAFSLMSKGKRRRADKEIQLALQIAPGLLTAHKFSRWIQQGKSVLYRGITSGIYGLMVCLIINATSPSGTNLEEAAYIAAIFMYIEGEFGGISRSRAAFLIDGITASIVGLLTLSLLLDGHQIIFLAVGILLLFWGAIGIHEFIQQPRIDIKAIKDEIDSLPDYFERSQGEL